MENTRDNGRTVWIIGHKTVDSKDVLEGCGSERECPERVDVSQTRVKGPRAIAVVKVLYTAVLAVICVPNATCSNPQIVQVAALRVRDANKDRTQVLVARWSRAPIGRTMFKKTDS